MVCCLLLLVEGFSQTTVDENTFKKENLFKVNGSINVTNTRYQAYGMEGQRDPLFYQLQANLNFKILTIDVPFTAVINNQKSAFGGPPPPPTRIGIKPTYKAFTFHAGYSAMNFSEFSLSGAQFLGGGVEVKPKKSAVSGKVMYGRFQQSNVEFDANHIIIGIPTYERWGGGAALDVKLKDQNFGAHVFTAKDDPSSVAGSDTLTLKAIDNLVFGFTANNKLSKKISVDGEISWSAYTPETRTGKDVLEGYSYLNNLGGLYLANNSSSFNKALFANLKYTEKKYNAKISYRRIDPDYRSLGAVSLNTDLEDITGSVTRHLFNKKLILTGTGGFQKNNLAEDQAARTTKLIGAINAVINPKEGWTINANYASFTTSTRMELVPEFLDTLRYAQVTKSGSGSIIRVIPREKTAHTFTLLGCYQEALANDVSTSNTVMGALSYNLNALKSKLNTTLAVNANQTTTEDAKMLLTGPSLNFGKPILKGKITPQIAMASMFTYIQEVYVGMIYNFRLGASYKLKKKHTFNLSGSFIHKDLNSAINVTQELVGTIAYNFNF